LTTLVLNRNATKRRALAVVLWTLQIVSAALFLFSGRSS
jgi:hypothetical protein